jgi:cell division protein FtsQ
MRKQETMSRAEQLRRKREKPVRNFDWHSRTAAPRAVPPRPAWDVRPRGAATRVHRMVSIPLSDPGVEVQFPALTISFSPRSLAILVAGLACAGMLFLLTGPMFRARAPQIDGVKYLTADAVAEASRLEGSNLFLISPAAVEAQILRRIPSVRGAQVSIDFSGDVRVSVREREPILLWTQNNESYWVDADGVFFPALADRADLVRVDVQGNGPQINFDRAADVDPDVVIQALELTLALPSGTRILYDSQHGLGMADIDGWTVYFGTSGQINLKMDLYRRMVSALSAEGIRPVYVSVENLRQPFYRR